MASRIGGALLLVVIALGAFGETVVRPGLVVPGDPAATAVDVQSLSRLGHNINVAALELHRDHNMTTAAGGALGFDIALAFLGSSYLVLAYLIVRSGYLPRTLGTLILVGGLGYLMKSSVAVLAPDLTRRIYPAIMVPGFIGELSLALWLVVNGVDMKAWTRVRAHGPRSATVPRPEYSISR